MIPLFKVHMPKTVIAPLKRTLLSGYIGQGPRVDEFEQALAPWVGSPHVLTLNSGTSALHLALRLAGVGPGDEVISTPMTCTATNEPIMERGAKIVWADIDPRTGNIDPRDVKRKLSNRTKAVMVVHWGGTPCDIDELNRVAREREVPVIEDAAHAFGATYKGRPIGSHSDYVCFSFQAIKHITTVDGGALVCRRTGDYRRGKLLRWYGIDRETPRRDFRCEEDILEHGYKFHMNDVAAAIGLEQLKYAPTIVAAHRENADYYRTALADVPGLRLMNYKADRLSSYWLFTILVENRMLFMQTMAEKGITVSQVHARNDTHTMCRAFRTSLPRLDDFVAHQVSIPAGWWITKQQRQYIAKVIRNFFGADRPARNVKTVVRR